MICSASSRLPVLRISPALRSVHSTLFSPSLIASSNSLAASACWPMVDRADPGNSDRCRPCSLPEVRQPFSLTEEEVANPGPDLHGRAVLVLNCSTARRNSAAPGPLAAPSTRLISSRQRTAVFQCRDDIQSGHLRTPESLTAQDVTSAMALQKHPQFEGLVNPSPIPDLGHSFRKWQKIAESAKTAIGHEVEGDWGIGSGPWLLKIRRCASRSVSAG